MSTPIQQYELSPGDPKYYAPPKWRRGDLNSLLVRSYQPPAESYRMSDFAATASPTFVGALSSIDLAEDSSDHSETREYIRVRVSALACTIGILAWIAFCGMVAYGRMNRDGDISQRNNIAQLQKVVDAEISLTERLEESNSALQKVSRPILAPTVAVADASGAMNAPLPLAIKVTNYAPDSTINLSGLPDGAKLSAGESVGNGQWRIAIDELPNAHVFPPPEFNGLITVVAELRSSNNQAIVRTPLKLSWRAAVNDPTAAIEPQASDSAANVANEKLAPKRALFEQFLAWQSASTVTTPQRHKVRRHFAKKHRHKLPSLVAERQISTRSSASSSSSSDDLFENDDNSGKRRAGTSEDVQIVIDRSWQRCGRLFGCDWERRR